MNRKTPARGIRPAILYVGPSRPETTPLAAALLERGYALCFEVLKALPSTVRALRPRAVLLASGPAPEEALKACLGLKRGLSAALPLILLFESDAPETLLAGFDAGADDCMGAFDPRVLAATIVAIIRRYENVASETEMLRGGHLRMDVSNFSVFLDSTPLRLTPGEFAILEMLLRRQESVVRRADILDRVRRTFGESLSHTIETQIYNLRRKLGPKAKGMIQTVSKIGYLLTTKPH